MSKGVSLNLNHVRYAIILGYVDIPTSEVTGRQPTERWYSVATSPAPGTKESRHIVTADSPMIRIKAQYQAVLVLPISVYQPMIEVLYCDNQT